MRHRRVSLILLPLVLGAALAGCFGNGDVDGANGHVDGSALAPYEETFFVSPVMFHPHPEGMLSAWVFSTRPDQTTFDIPVIRVTEGQTVRITLTNTHNFPHTIHWHGLHVPWAMDGVPFVTQDPIEPGQSFTYEFVAKPAGTHFFHCHFDAPHHLDMGMYGVIIVEPAAGEPYPYDREEILVLDSWDSKHLHQTDFDLMMFLDSLQDPSGDPVLQAERIARILRDAVNDPSGYAFIPEEYTNPLRAERDWYPVTHPPWNPSYDTYTINGKSYPLTDPIHVTEGETVKLRLLNVGHSVHSLHVHGHHFLVTHKDGYALPAPYYADTVPILPGERYDVLLTADNPGNWMLHDHVGPHGMNNHIAPGGIMTHIVYEGWAQDAGGGHDDHFGHATAGDFLGLYRR